MIEAEGVVVARDGEYVLVETERRSSCGDCSAKGCGTGALHKVLGARRQQVRVRNRFDARVGDTLLLGLQEDALVRGSLAVYMVPLLAMLAGALVGEGIAPQWYAEAELLAIVGGGLGLLAGLGWLRRFGRAAATDERYQAVALHILRRPGEAAVDLERLKHNFNRQEQQ